MHGLGIRLKNGSVKGFDDGADGSGRSRLHYQGARRRFRKIHVQVDFLFIPGGPGIGRRGDFTNFRIGGGTGRMEKGAVRIWTSPLFVIEFLFLWAAHRLSRFLFFKKMDFKEPHRITEKS